MRRHAPAFLAFLIIAAGCSARSGFYVTDGGTGGDPSDLVTGGTAGDGGKKRDSATEGPDPTDEDAGKPDAKLDAKKDTSTTPSTLCTPDAVLSFAPTWKAPKPLHANACTALQAEALMCLFDSAADQTACEAITKDVANKTCFDCIFTPSSAAALGPVVLTGSLGSINLAGCVARTSGNVTSTGCGAKMQAADQCGDEACEANCPVDEFDNGASLDAYNDCTAQAASSVCATYAADAECATDLLDTGGASAACAAGQDFLSRATALAKLFCVP